MDKKRTKVKNSKTKRTAPKVVGKIPSREPGYLYFVKGLNVYKTKMKREKK